MWKEVIGLVGAKEAVGKAFRLCCPRHSDADLQAFTPDDFERLSPEGGSQLPCNRRLNDCGYHREARCHSESMYRIFTCPKPCERLHSPCIHSCQKMTCGEDRGNCMMKLENILLPCVHLKDKVNCYETQDLAKINCNILVERLIQECGHVIPVKCSRDTNSPSFKCSAACGTIWLAGIPVQALAVVANSSLMIKSFSSTRLVPRSAAAVMKHVTTLARRIAMSEKTAVHVSLLVR